MKTIIAFCFLFLALSNCAPANPCQDANANGACLRILFIGNSYTYTNDLPGTFAALAQSGGHAVATSMSATGGWTLKQHTESADTLKQINRAQWDYVVLQEQSQTPSDVFLRKQIMLPAASALASEIRQNGATPLLFMTWAHRDGWQEKGWRDYASMQGEIERGYLEIARALQAPVAPVGAAWNIVQRDNPRIALWQDDNSHPTTEGTYLAACVFYAVLFRSSPEGLSYRAGLDEATARVMQTTAARIVLENGTEWNLR